MDLFYKKPFILLISIDQCSLCTICNPKLNFFECLKKVVFNNLELPFLWGLPNCTAKYMLYFLSFLYLILNRECSFFSFRSVMVNRPKQREWCRLRRLFRGLRYVFTIISCIFDRKNTVVVQGMHMWFVKLWAQRGGNFKKLK